MKRELVALLVLAFLAYPIPRLCAEEPKTDSTLTQYLEQLQVKLEHAAERVNKPNASGSSVVGLRGAKQEPLSHQLYWKGKKGDTPVTLDEVKLLRQAVEQARAGQKTEAIIALQSFEKKYPKSALLPDAQVTLQQLSAQVPPASVAVSTSSAQ
ncbi:MAG: hypothetical protein WC859_04065 [Elusimicrobiota bacterium]|jgi:TolA-binding protein